MVTRTCSKEFGSPVEAVPMGQAHRQVQVGFQAANSALSIPKQLAIASFRAAVLAGFRLSTHGPPQELNAVQHRCVTRSDCLTL